MFWWLCVYRCEGSVVHSSSINIAHFMKPKGNTATPALRNQVCCMRKQTVNLQEITLRFCLVKSVYINSSINLKTKWINASINMNKIQGNNSHRMILAAWGRNRLWTNKWMQLDSEKHSYNFRILTNVSEKMEFQVNTSKST